MILSSECSIRSRIRQQSDGHGGLRERLYCALGYGLIQAIKAVMSYEDEVCHSPVP